MKTSTDKLNQAIERMTTGFKINHAKDNAANYSISTDMTTKIGAYQVAEDNCAQGLDMIATASESLSLIQDKLERLRALATQASNGTYGAQSLKAINAEANALVDEIERQYNTTEYNGINLAKGKVISTEESEFIKDIDRRDTSKMTTLASVAIDEALTSGTYSISTADELAKLATMTNNGLIGASTEFVLANDIDLQAWCDANSATGGWVPIGRIDRTLDDVYQYSFKASFDGNGYSVSNLMINRTQEAQGLFGLTSNSIIKNVAIKGVDVTNPKTSGSVVKYYGTLLGYGYKSCVENCYSTGNLNSFRSTLVGGLIGQMYMNCVVSDCYSNVNISGTGWDIGGLIGNLEKGCCLNNSFATGNITGSANTAGGLVGLVINSGVEGCYSTGIVDATCSGGLFAALYGNSFCKNVWTSSDVLGLLGAGLVYYAGVAHIENAMVLSENLNYKGIFVAEQRKNQEIDIIIKDSYYADIYEGSSVPVSAISPTYLNNISSYSGDKPFEFINEANINVRDSSINLQVGTNSDTNSQIGTSMGYVLDNLNAFRNIGKSQFDYVSLIDKVMSSLSSKQTEYGAVQNRLESALDEISIKYENLVSSRSTLRDADIAKVSSTYIQQQILQQASATLMATANQSPAIALQLI